MSALVDGSIVLRVLTFLSAAPPAFPTGTPISTWPTHHCALPFISSVEELPSAIMRMILQDAFLFTLRNLVCFKRLE